MLPFIQPTLQTPRLTLRPFQASDAPEVQQQAGAWEIADTTLLIPHPYPLHMAEKWIASRAPEWETRQSACFAIVLRETKELCGAIGMSFMLEYARAEIGYWISVPHWGKGYGTEATREAVRFGFEQMRLNKICAHHFARNPASGRILRKIGMSHEGCLRQHVCRWSGFEDLECYGILRSEWEAGQRNASNPQHETPPRSD